MKRNRERGAVAVVVALSATMIFALCALGVDLGAGFARKRDIQTQADLATLAAAAQLPHNSANDSAIYDAATNYAIENEVGGQDKDVWDFTDGDTTNGFIEFDGKNKLRLYAPSSRVEFLMLAPAAGLPDHMNVSAVAAAEIRSPGKALPFFISQTCGWGLQTILDQTKGPPLPPGFVPNLTPTSSPALTVELSDIDPTDVAKDVSPSPTMTINVVDGGKPIAERECGWVHHRGLETTR